MEQNSNRLEQCWYKDVCLADPYECELCIKYLEMQHLMDESNLPKARQKPQPLSAPKCDIEAFTRLADIKSNILDFVEQGKNLYIASSTTGNGKTSWAIKLLLKYFDEIWAGNGFRVRGLFINVPTFLIKSKDFKNIDSTFEHIKKHMDTVDLVVWDDIASTSMSGYDYSQLLMHIDARFLNKVANIFTGNFETKEQVESQIGQKLASRLFGAGTEIITFRGGDMR